MGILKGLRLNRIRTIAIVIAVMLIVMASGMTAYAAQEQSSDVNDGAITDVSGSIVEYQEERIEEIPYKTLYQYSSELAWGESAISVKGETGTKRVTGKVITYKGTIAGRTGVSETVIKEAVDELILIGSLDALPATNYDYERAVLSAPAVYDMSVYMSLPDDEKGTKDAQDIVEYALQFIGNPYVWGGTSLTSGCDCSGFVYSVFNDCGYEMPRNNMQYAYPVSVDELLPGDIIAYPGHYAIYIGGGMELGALNPSQGICIVPAGCVDSYFVAVRVIDNK